MTYAGSFKALDSLRVGDRSYSYVRLAALQDAGIAKLAQLPFSLKILLENLLRFEDGVSVEREDVEALARWHPGRRSEREIAFRPARVLLQDFTGVPAVVDLAAMRDAMADIGGDPKAINPLQPVELVIDHSVQVDAFGNSGAFAQNAHLEFERNRERYAFLKWGQEALHNFRAVPPDTGIVHQVNIEFLARVIFGLDGGSGTDGRGSALANAQVNASGGLAHRIPIPSSAPIRTRRWSMVWACWRGASAESKRKPRCSGSPSRC